MLNPLNASKSPLSSRVALPIALMLAGIFGLSIALVQPPTPHAKIADPVAPQPVETENLSTESLAEQSEPTPSIPDADQDLISFCARHVTEKRSFVVFKRGTCVVVNEPCEDPMAYARGVLAKCKDPDAKFMTEPTNEGDMIVAFKDPVFHRFSYKELEKLQPWLHQAATALLSPTEAVSAGEGWVPPGNAKIGLLARRRLLEDAAQVVPIKVIRAKERALASN
jgi:hypothetical protein